MAIDLAGLDSQLASQKYCPAEGSVDDTINFGCTSVLCAHSYRAAAVQYENRGRLVCGDEHVVDVEGLQRAELLVNALRRRRRRPMRRLRRAGRTVSTPVHHVDAIVHRGGTFRVHAFFAGHAGRRG